MNSEKGVKSGVSERVTISCPTCGTRHDLPKTELSVSYRPYIYCCIICEELSKG